MARVLPFTCSSWPFTTPVPSPMVPLSEAGAVLVGELANPLVWMMLAKFAGSSRPTSVQVEKEPPLA